MKEDKREKRTNDPQREQKKKSAAALPAFAFEFALQILSDLNWPFITGSSRGLMDKALDF